MGILGGIFGKFPEKGIRADKTPPETFIVYSDDTNPQNSRKFHSWEEAVAFARGLARQSPEAYVTLHRYPNEDRVHYRVHSSGDVEKVDIRQLGFK
jgi:hypothetical protein